VPRLGEARLAPTIDMFTCPRNNIVTMIVEKTVTGNEIKEMKL
jgi:hypothetical protein